jgi:hypothetical protein
MDVAALPGGKAVDLDSAVEIETAGIIEVVFM